MNKKFFTALAFAAVLLIGGPVFGNGRGGGGGGGGRAAAFSGGGRGASFSGGGRGATFSGGGRGASYSGGGRGGYRGGSVAFGGNSRGYGGRRGGYGYGRGYGGYGYGGYVYGYPYYYGDDSGYDSGYAEPVYPDSGSAYSDSNDGGGPVSVRVQTELAREGYYRGPIDGIVGPGTQAAISAYQRDNGLRVTGTINGKLLDALDLE